MLGFVTWNADPILFSFGPFAVRWYIMLIPLLLCTYIIVALIFPKKNKKNTIDWVYYFLIFFTLCVVFFKQNGFGPYIFEPDVRWYGIAFVLGFIIGYWIVAAMFKHEGAPEKWLESLLICLVVCTIVGARLGHVLFYEWDYYSAHPMEILKVWNGGLASHGGTIAIFIGIWIFSRLVTHKSMSWVLDKIVAPIALTGGLIRLGNLMNSEIYGGPTDLPWGFLFVRNGETLPCHPTQLYEAGCYFVLFALLMWMYWKKNAEERPWLMTGIFFLVTFGSRFLIEYVKNVQVPWEVQMRADWGIDQGQLLSIPFILLGIGMIVYAMVKPRQHWNFPNRFSDADEKK